MCSGRNNRERSEAKQRTDLKLKMRLQKHPPPPTKEPLEKKYKCNELMADGKECSYAGGRRHHFVQHQKQIHLKLKDYKCTRSPDRYAPCI